MTPTRPDAVAQVLGAIPQAGAPSPRAAGRGSARGSAHARHAQHEWVGAGWVVTWALTGTVLPGAGLVAAGYRRTGFAVAAAAAVAALGAAAWLALDPVARRSAAAGAPVVASLLALLLVVTTLGLLRSTTSGRRADGQALAAMTALAAALVAAGWYLGLAAAHS